MTNLQNHSEIFTGEWKELSTGPSNSGGSYADVGYLVM